MYSQPLTPNTQHNPQPAIQDPLTGAGSSNGVWQDKLVIASKPRRKYMTREKFWANFDAGHSSVLRVSCSIALITGGILRHARIWPSIYCGITSCAAMVSKVSTALQTNTTLVVQITEQSSTLGTLAGYGSGLLRAASCEVAHIVGVGVVVIGGITLLYMGGSYLHAAAVGERNECKKMLTESSENTLALQEEVKDCYRERAELVKDIRWYQTMTPENAERELDRRHQKHLDSVNHYNMHDPQKLKVMRNEAAPLEAEFRRRHGLRSFESSAEYLDHRIVRSQSDSIGYRLLKRKRTAYPMILRNGTSACRKQLVNIYSKVTARDSVNWRQDSYCYEERKQAGALFYRLEDERRKLDAREQESREETELLLEDYKRLL